jgi:peptide/nickel transport system substrate-binding protein
MSKDKEVHPYIPKLIDQLETGKVSRREFLRTSTLLGMSATAAYAAAGLVDPLATPARAETKAGVLRIAHRVPDISTPARLGWFRFINLTLPVIQTLTVGGQDNITRPLLASWQASEDLKTWTFKVVPNARWHDGKPFTADDAVWNLKRLLDPVNGSSMAGIMAPYLLKQVEKDGKKTREFWDANAIEKVDDQTFRLNMQRPQVAIPELLFHHTGGMMHPSSEGRFGVGALGTGPFKLTELVTGQKAIYTAVADYWGTASKVERVEFIDLGDDQTAAFGAMAAKQVHGIFDFDFSQFDAYKSLTHVNIHTVETATCGTLNMLVTEKPFDDPRVRLAIRYATNKKQMMELSIRQNGVEAQHHHVAPVHPDYAPIPDFPYDPAKAAALLKEAGLANGFDSEVFVMAESPWHLAAVQAMVEQMRPVGIRLTIRVLPSTQFWDVLGKRAFKLSFSDWSHRPLGTQQLAGCYRTGTDWNIFRWSNQEFDTVLNKAESVLDPVARREHMKRLEEIMQIDGPVALPCWVNMATAYDKRVKGFKMHPSGVIFLTELSLDAA